MTVGSLFTGIGGFDLGLERAGIVPLWQVEIDKHCNRLLADRWPVVERHTDVRTVGSAGLALPPVDIVCGGFPCQDLSVAGRRAGLAGERSGLWFDFHRVVAQLRPRWVVIENVPGLLSSNAGADFAVVVSGLVQLGYGVAWRVLDAQFAGLAQRRDRVFVVASLGDGGAAQVLFEPASVRWDPPPRRAAAQDLGPTLSSRPRGSGGLGTDAECGGALVAGSVLSSNARVGLSDGANVIADTLRVGGREQGAGSSSDNTPLVFDETQVTSATNRCHPTTDITHPLASGARPPTLAFGGNRQGGSLDIATAQHGHHSRYDFATETMVVNLRGRDEGNVPELDVDGLAAVRAAAGGSSRSFVAFGWNKSAHQNMAVDDATTDALQANHSSNPAVAGPVRSNPRNNSNGATEAAELIARGAVRRLTPRECERLQGFPDDWTAGFSDSVRYRMLGNAVAVPVAAWIGRRLAAVA